MNVARELPNPLNTFVVDLPANQYKDFELPPDSTYPLRGVTYSVDYGYLPNHTGEDTHELDLFMGNSTGGRCGSVLVDRGSGAPNEHKFYAALSDIEVEQILDELDPVLVAHSKLESLDKLLEEIAAFRNPE